MAFGVYVHVPFCRHRCDYCAFATWTGKDALAEPYVDAVVGEISGAGLPPATSVFFGGGTPSRLGGAPLARILDAVERAPDAEVTVECNPEDVTAELLSAYRAAGVTRLSFGVQSMQPHVLASLGRRHGNDHVRQAVALAADAGFADAFSVDLIMGAAGETLDDWAATIDAALALEPSHVSAYGLTVEPGTPLAGDATRAPDPDLQADMYERAERLLSAAGLRWYEISNWARPGAECRHNQLYWAQEPYRGVGCAAHSMSRTDSGGVRRWWNLRTPERYIAAVAAGRPLEAAGEELDPSAAAIEALQLQLRTSRGVPDDVLPADDPLLDGLVERVDGRVVLTVAGRLLANEVALRLRAPQVVRPGP